MPQKNVNNRAMYWPRGRVWGGSSSLNAMVYVRGHAEDYNRWEREGAAGWGYEAVLPYFKKAQVRSPRVTCPLTLTSGWCRPTAVAAMSTAATPGPCT